MRISIRQQVTIGLAVAFAALVLAACGGDSSGDDSASGVAGAMDRGDSGLVSVRSVDGMDVLADSKGRTLYTADVERGGRIRCVEACTSFWDPVSTSAKEAKATAASLKLSLGAVRRPDGARQLTLDGLPLYTFTQEGPDSLEGDGFVDDFNGTHFEWAVAGAGGAASSGDSNATGGSYPY